MLPKHFFQKEVPPKLNPPNSFSKKSFPKKFLPKIPPKSSQDFENIRLPTSHLEAENPFGLVYNINYMLNSEHLSLVNKIGDKTEFTITRVHCTCLGTQGLANLIIVNHRFPIYCLPTLIVGQRSIYSVFI